MVTDIGHSVIQLVVQGVPCAVMNDFTDASKGHQSTQLLQYNSQSKPALKRTAPG